MGAYYSRSVFLAVCRDIAQSGSAPALGAGCREFESLYPDHFFNSFVCIKEVVVLDMRL